MYHLAYYLSTKAIVNRTKEIDEDHQDDNQSSVKKGAEEDKKQVWLKGFLRFLFLIFRHPCFHNDERNG